MIDIVEKAVIQIDVCRFPEDLGEVDRLIQKLGKRRDQHKHTDDREDALDILVHFPFRHENFAHVDEHDDAGDGDDPTGQNTHDATPFSPARRWS